VALFRRGAVEFDHEKFLYDDWHIPQYFSRTPLPQNASKSLGVHISLPKGQHVENTKVPMEHKDSVEKAVRIAFSKCRQIEGDENSYVLKALGLKDYMEGDKVLFDYEYVRRCIHDSVPVTLSLVPRPAPTEYTPEVDLVLCISLELILPFLRLLLTLIVGFLPVFHLKRSLLCPSLKWLSPSKSRFLEWIM
jgi:hypothetical protein